ncbi:MAG: rhodanese-related sulfurtransferase [Nanoarchaeota archaeon]
MEQISILLFYKYTYIKNPVLFRAENLLLCKQLGIKGRILIAHEGINGSISGSKEQTEKYKKLLRKDSRLSDIKFKEDLGLQHPFKKMIIKIKKEIVNFGKNVDLRRTGEYLSPAEFLDLYKDENKIGKEIIILDARNNYESKIGKFKGAITPDIETFREFSKIAEQLKDKKDKKIVMYCTGGIRCEKATAYFKEQGFKDVAQLEGGILTFAKEFQDTIWEGSCFVFDKRLKSNVNSKESPITKCELCDVPCDLYKNCRNKICDKYTIICIPCGQKYGYCCSPTCFKSFQAVRLKEKN